MIPINILKRRSCLDNETRARDHTRPRHAPGASGSSSTLGVPSASLRCPRPRPRAPTPFVLPPSPLLSPLDCPSSLAIPSCSKASSPHGAYRPPTFRCSRPPSTPPRPNQTARRTTLRNTQTHTTQTQNPRQRSERR